MSTKLILSDVERDDWEQLGAGSRQVSLSGDEVQAILSADLPGPIAESPSHTARATGSTGPGHPHVGQASGSRRRP